MEDALSAHVAAKEEDLGEVLERSHGAVQLQARARMRSQQAGNGHKEIGHLFRWDHRRPPDRTRLAGPFSWEGSMDYLIAS